MYLFPIVGIVIGLVIGSLGYGLSLYLEPVVVSLVVVLSISGGGNITDQSTITAVDKITANNTFLLSI